MMQSESFVVATSDFGSHIINIFGIHSAALGHWVWHAAQVRLTLPSTEPFKVCRRSLLGQRMMLHMRLPGWVVDLYETKMLPTILASLWFPAVRLWCCLFQGSCSLTGKPKRFRGKSAT